MRWLAVIFFLGTGLSVNAQTFEARINDTQWILDTSALHCRLTQPIPDFGEARFEQKNAGKLRLIFESRNYPVADDHVDFAVTTAPWKSARQETELVRLPVESGQTRFSLNGPQAHQALAALMAGEFPLIRYASQTLNTEVEARISTVSATRSLNVFSQCLEDLHPQSFADVKQQHVYFDSESSELSADAREKLDQIVDYLKIDDEIRMVEIRAHTDSFGKRKLNKPLSEERATVVKDYLTAREVSAELISTESLMATAPAAPNDTAEGRAQNRRAEIILKR